MMRRLWAFVVLVMLATTGCATIDRVSTSSSGSAADADTTGVVVSGSGRYVAFASAATNLVPGVNNGQTHVYRKDRATGAIVNVDRRGTVRAARAALGAISDDGNLVAFITDSPLIAADTNGLRDAYVRNIAAGTTVLGSVLPDGSRLPPATVNAGVFSVSFDDGQHLFFDAGTGTSALPGSLGFLRNLAAGTTALVLNTGFHESVFVSRDDNHIAYNFNCGTPRVCTHNAGLVDLAAPYAFTPSICDGGSVAGLSDDGRYVLFNRSAGTSSCASNNLPGRFDRVTGTWLDLGIPIPAASDVRATGISGDGRFVLFVGDDAARSGGVVGHRGAFVLDVVTGWSERVTANALDADANASLTPTDAFALSRDGRTVVFTSSATNLVGGDVNGRADGFARSTPRPRVISAGQPVNAGASHQVVTLNGAEFLAGATAVVLGGDVTVNSAIPSPDGHALTLDVSVAPGALLAFHDVLVSNGGGFGHADALCGSCLHVLN